jgi:signal peptidase I
MHVAQKTPRKKKQSSSGRSFLLELPGLLLAALIVAVLIKTFIIQPFYIPSESMEHTLEVDDKVMVSKLAYRFGDIERGDIVVFETGPELEESVPEAVIQSVLDALGIRTSGREDLIKRVIAIGGDEIEIRDNRVLVNGTAIDEPYLVEDVFMADMPPRTVPEEHIWVMGDNRNQSSDSRVFGPVSVESVVGQAIVRIWPVDRIGGL